MIAARRAQRSFADGFIAEQLDDLREPWMGHADQALNDDRLLEIMQAAWSKLCKKSKTRGRPGTPAEIILRLLLLKHIRDWSYEELEREVRAIWSIASSRASVAARFPTINPFPDLGARWEPMLSNSISGSLLLPARTTQCTVASCAWIPPSWRPTFVSFRERCVKALAIADNFVLHGGGS